MAPDSDFVISVLHENEEFHESCVAFATRLRGNDVRLVYTPLLRIDFWNGWRQAVRRRGLTRDLTGDIEETADERAQREAIFRRGDRLLNDFLASFDTYRLDLSAELLDESLALIARYNLRPHDGCTRSECVTQWREYHSLPRCRFRFPSTGWNCGTIRYQKREHGVAALALEFTCRGLSP